MIKQELVKTALDAARRSGAEDVEVYAEITKGVKVSIQRTEIHGADSSTDEGVAVRAFYKGGMGFAYTTSFDKDKVKWTARQAAALANCSSKDRFFKSLPRRAKPKEVKGLFDRKLSSCSLKDILVLGQKITDTIKNINKEVNLNGVIEATLSREFRIANTNGIDFYQKESAIETSLFGIIERSKEDISSAVEVGMLRALGNFDYEALCKNLVKKAEEGLGAIHPATKKCSILLTPLAVTSLLQYISGCLDGLAVSYKNTCLCGLLGKKVAGSDFTLIDNGVIDGGFFSSPVDGEGSVRTPFPVFENGILKSFLHTSYSAGKMGHKNTSSSNRGSFRQKIASSFTNVNITPGTKSLGEIVKSIDEGLLLDLFPRGDVLTGDISSAVDYGREIKNGEIKSAVKGAMLGANILDVLKNIVAISKETRNFCGSVLPYILISDVQIAG